MCDLRWVPTQTNFTWPASSEEERENHYDDALKHIPVDDDTLLVDMADMDLHFQNNVLEENEMVLSPLDIDSDDEVEISSPVPVLRGLEPFLGRQPWFNGRDVRWAYIDFGPVLFGTMLGGTTLIGKQSKHDWHDV